MIQLETKLGHYCSEVVSNLVSVHNIKGVKIKTEQIGGRGGQNYQRKWSITVPLATFTENKAAFKDLQIKIGRKIVSVIDSHM